MRRERSTGCRIEARIVSQTLQDKEQTPWDGESSTRQGETLLTEPQSLWSVPPRSLSLLGNQVLAASLT